MKFNLEATGIGSLPFKDPDMACRTILNNFRKIPFWPQLPKRAYLENMYVQFSERIPGLVVNDVAKTIHIDSQRAMDEIEGVYEKYLAGDMDFFAVSPDYASGLYKFLELFKAAGKETMAVKGQVTGPISFALFLQDESNKPIIYNKDLFDILVKIISMRARWQIKKIKEVFPLVIISIDEPYLVSIGSSYVNIDLPEASARLDEVSAAIKAEGAMSAVHCCGNTDWSLLLKRDIDILSFDAYNFMKEFSLYANDLKDFLKKEKTIAWGIVPSGDSIDKESEHTLVGRFKEGLGALRDKGIEAGDISSLITPSCGVGTLSEERAERVLAMTKAVSVKLTE